MLNWPNRITLARILATPLLVMVAIRADEGPAYRAWTLALFVLLALTDAVDGFLARALKQKTPLGTFLDPLADKILLTTATILLVCPLWPDPATGEPARLLPPSVAVVLISRDLILSLGAVLIFILTGTVDVRPSLLGKVTTAFQIAMVVGLLLPVSAWFRAPLLGGVVAVTVASAVGYVYDGCRQLARLGSAPGRPPSESGGGPREA